MRGRLLHWKRGLSLLLALAMVFGLLLPGAMAREVVSPADGYLTPVPLSSDERHLNMVLIQDGQQVTDVAPGSDFRIEFFVSGLIGNHGGGLGTPSDFAIWFPAFWNREAGILRNQDNTANAPNITSTNWQTIFTIPDLSGSQWDDAPDQEPSLWEMPQFINHPGAGPLNDVRLIITPHTTHPVDGPVGYMEWWFQPIGGSNAPTYFDPTAEYFIFALNFRAADDAGTVADFFFRGVQDGDNDAMPFWVADFVGGPWVQGGGMMTWVIPFTGAVSLRLNDPIIYTVVRNAQGDIVDEVQVGDIFTVEFWLRNVPTVYAVPISQDIRGLNGVHGRVFFSNSLAGVVDHDGNRPPNSRFNVFTDNPEMPVQNITEHPDFDQATGMLLYWGQRVLGAPTFWYEPTGDAFLFSLRFEALAPGEFDAFFPENPGPFERLSITVPTSNFGGFGDPSVTTIRPPILPTNLTIVGGTGFMVTYRPNGGIGPVPNDHGPYEFGDNAQARAVAPGALTRPGFVQLGWLLNCPDHGAVVAPGGPFIIQGNATLYARWLYIGL